MQGGEMTTIWANLSAFDAERVFNLLLQWGLKPFVDMILTADDEILFTLSQSAHDKTLEALDTLNIPWPDSEEEVYHGGIDTVPLVPIRLDWLFD